MPTGRAADGVRVGAPPRPRNRSRAATMAGLSPVPDPLRAAARLTYPWRAMSELCLLAHASCPSAQCRLPAHTGQCRYAVTSERMPLRCEIETWVHRTVGTLRR